MRWLKRAGLIALAAAVFAIAGGPSAAFATGGSDSATPYTVTAAGVQLPAGTTFEANGHVNYRTSLRSGGVHFDPNNNQPGGAFIGQSFFPIALEPGECITWVQVSPYNEHFGEGGQAPVCAPPAEPPVEEEPPAEEEPPVFTEYEVCATWLINAPAPEVWPGQTILSRECGYLPPAECVDIRVQVDEYWIRDAEDEAYWLALEVLNSPADDAQLEPHDYSVVTIPAKDCTPPVEPPVEEPPAEEPPVEEPPAEEQPPVVNEPPVVEMTPVLIPLITPTPTPEPESELLEALPDTGSKNPTPLLLGAFALMGAGLFARKLARR